MAKTIDGWILDPLFKQRIVHQSVFANVGFLLSAEFFVVGGRQSLFSLFFWNRMIGSLVCDSIKKRYSPARELPFLFDSGKGKSRSSLPSLEAASTQPGIPLRESAFRAAWLS
jgi:hypothetical protein